ncbi:MAG: hypothetical protein NC412_14850 [Roseburia sp.]|nr:hypothetical protein [Roseburia sp.]MCM1280021.1 hypothetical protein [Robinsoniella sp.]
MKKLTIIKTDYTYEQLKERFEKNVPHTLSELCDDEIEDVFVGNIMNEKIILSYFLTARRGGNNELHGVIVESENGCTISYEMEHTATYYNFGYIMLIMTVAANIILMSKGLFLQFIIGIILLDIAFCILSFSAIDTKKEEEKCRKKINEIAGSM